jgi:hypothetical protein
MMLYKINHPFIIRRYPKIYRVFGTKPKGVDVARLAYHLRKEEIKREQGVLL